MSLPVNRVVPRARVLFVVIVTSDDGESFDEHGV